TNSEDFINQQNLGFEVGGDRECQSKVHAARVVFYRRVDEFFDFGEGFNLVKLAPDFNASHAQNSAVQVDVFTTTKFRMKPGTNFKQAGDPPVEFNYACRRSSYTRKQFQQSGFACA